MPNGVSPSNITSSGTNAGYGSDAVAHTANEYFAGANGTSGPMVLGASGDTNGDSWTVTISWQRINGTWAQSQVVVTDEIHDPMTLLWPTHLRLEINPVGIGTVDIQRWIHKNQAPVARIKCAPGIDKRDFNDLLESLRNCGGYATAGWEAGGSYQTRLLLTPLCMDLLCVAFPVNGIPEPMSQSHGRDCMKRPVNPNTPRWSGPAPLADPVVEGNCDPWLGIGENTTSYAHADMDAVFCGAGAMESSADSGLGGGSGGGPLNGIGTYAARYPSADLGDDSDTEKADREGN